MNFIVMGVPYYDYMLATVVEGLKKLGHRCFDLGGQPRNYMEVATKEMNIKPDVFIYAPLDANVGDYNIDSSYPIKKILLWVHDKILEKGMVHRFEPSRYKFDAAFVREMDEEHAKYPNVYPINFGIEDRFYCITGKGMRGLGLRPVDIIFQSYINPGEGGYPHHAKRREFVDNIKKDFSDCLIDIGYDKNKEPDSNYPLPYSRHEHFTDYFRALSRAKIGLCLHGAGEDCARTWEVAASGAVPAIQRYTIKHVEPWWRDGVNCIEFDTYEEFREKVAGYLTEPHYPRLLRIQQHAWAFGRTYHRTQHRAQYILDTIGVKNEHV